MMRIRSSGVAWPRRPDPFRLPLGAVAVNFGRLQLVRVDTLEILSDPLRQPYAVA
ncbi:MAG TPA: hypothetical protein VK771_04735 [Acidimicrobiia bacterium]|nr:hypothetical protein [Acidimicrobiia bacterium]